ncbi:hypothetical protein BZZ01_32710 (plasmid) [Nostocales cyanobacterium HT-58-2]|nr:hypothetical protein BZZ01_32710 [Nostocales cyanobacterium HT-58-2]
MLSDALAATKLIQDESERAYALSALADKLPPELLSDALAATKQIQDESERAKALSALADKLPPRIVKRCTGCHQTNSGLSIIAPKP